MLVFLFVVVMRRRVTCKLTGLKLNIHTRRRPSYLQKHPKTRVWIIGVRCTSQTLYCPFVFLQILIAILIGWAVCGILTVTDAIPYDKNSTAFNTRTDARSYIIESSNWFYFPYPGSWSYFIVLVRYMF